MKPSFSTTVASSLVVFAVIGATADISRSAAPTHNGKVVFQCDARAGAGPPTPVGGQCTITGTIADRGSFVDDALPCANPHVRTVKARRGTIRIEVYRKRGSWLILGGTRAYRGLRGQGWEASNIPCRGPGLSVIAPIRMVGTVSRQ